RRTAGDCAHEIPPPYQLRLSAPRGVAGLAHGLAGATIPPRPGSGRLDLCDRVRDLILLGGAGLGLQLKPCCAPSARAFRGQGTTEARTGRISPSNGIGSPQPDGSPRDGDLAGSAARYGAPAQQRGTAGTERRPRT